MLFVFFFSFVALSTKDAWYAMIPQNMDPYRKHTRFWNRFYVAHSLIYEINSSPHLSKTALASKTWWGIIIVHYIFTLLYSEGPTIILTLWITIAAIPIRSFCVLIMHVMIKQQVMKLPYITNRTSHILSVNCCCFFLYSWLVPPTVKSHWSKIHTQLHIKRHISSVWLY